MLFWNNVGRLAWEIKSIHLIICKVVQLYAFSKLHFEFCKWLMLLSKFHLQWCIKLLKCCWIAQSFYNCIRLNEIYLKTTSFFSPSHVCGHEKKLLLCLFMYFWKGIEIIIILNNIFFEFHTNTHTHTGHLKPHTLDKSIKYNLLRGNDCVPKHWFFVKLDLELDFKGIFMGVLVQRQ
jgi:hypothetical protein